MTASRRRIAYVFALLVAEVAVLVVVLPPRGCGHNHDLRQLAPKLLVDLARSHALSLSHPTTHPSAPGAGMDEAHLTARASFIQRLPQRLRERLERVSSFVPPVRGEVAILVNTGDLAEAGWDVVVVTEDGECTIVGAQGRKEVTSLAKAESLSKREGVELYRFKFD